ncbi:glycosyltransferase [Lactobacillus sp. ESL0233]|uniref:glycosyltransferase family 2 protein n=1 Tax=Lactobacillus sp. ESL0233 TaxID=2069354 RepID=UPI000EFC782B|nr:glycosyltransferase family 2 protein [Lactobacillus sp. ESL0233]RMC42061.1 glycosyltransferase [Lactobacillus sp. ESL0233]
MVLEKLSIIVPCFNEEEVLPKSKPILIAILEQLIECKEISTDSQIIFVDDGSCDHTWQLIKGYCTCKNISGIKLSRNFGHQKALLAGLSTASDSDMIVSIDSDLQDDPRAIVQMVEEYHKGADIVYGIRDKRDCDTVFKRTTANWFYKLMSKLGVEMIPNAADFRLMSKRAIKLLLSYPERNLFLRGLIPMIGLPSVRVYFKRHERIAGKSKYSLKKMLALALNGITSFSIVPIRLIMSLGLLIVLIAVFLLFYTLIQNAKGKTESGWTSLMISILAMGGVQLICISVIGEYVGKIFNEVKRRPRFIIEQDLYHKNN